MPKLNVAIVGLGFGHEFVPIYLHHPDVASVVVCDSNPEKLREIADKFEIEGRADSLEEVLQMPDVDAVHLISPIPVHGAQSVAVLQAGKHCACTVPMATSLEEIRAIIAAQQAAGRNYMMMETAVYTREFLYVQELQERGEFGKIQLLRGAHYQDMEHWPEYWMGLPPMHYATHAIAPLLRLANTRARQVHCFGSGTMRAELRERYGNPFPAETAIFRLQNCDAAAEVTRTLFETARSYSESFTVYGESLSFEWQQIEAEEPVVFRMGPLQPERRRARAKSFERVAVPDYADRLPPEIARFTQSGVYDQNNPHQSFLQGGGHGGSHPHLVHEFVASIVENRPSAIDAVTAANWTAAGICAHQSAMQDGASVEIPDFAALSGNA